MLPITFLALVLESVLLLAEGCPSVLQQYVTVTSRCLCRLHTNG